MTKYITRTTKIAEVKTLGINLESNTVEERTLEIPAGISLKGKDFENAIREEAGEKYAIAQVKGISVREEKRRMTEANWLLFSEVVTDSDDSDE